MILSKISLNIFKQNQVKYIFLLYFELKQNYHLYQHSLFISEAQRPSNMDQLTSKEERNFERDSFEKTIKENNVNFLPKTQKSNDGPEPNPESYNSSNKMIKTQKNHTQIALNNQKLKNKGKIDAVVKDEQQKISSQMNSNRLYQFRTIKNDLQSSNTLPIEQPIESNFLQQEQAKRAQKLKRIYLSRQNPKKSKFSHPKKTPNSVNSMNKTFNKKPKESINKKQLISQQVQTQKRQYKALNTQKYNYDKQAKNTNKRYPTGGNSSKVKINSFHNNDKSSMELRSEVGFKKSKSKLFDKSQKKFKNLTYILETDLDEPKLPQKSNLVKHNNFSTKFYLSNSFNAQESTAPSLYTANYLEEISKLSLNFNSQINTLRKDMRNGQNSQFLNTIQNNYQERPIRNSRNNRYLEPIIKNSTISSQKYVQQKNLKQESTLTEKKSMSIIAEKSETANYSMNLERPLFNQRSGSIFEQIQGQHSQKNIPEDDFVPHKNYDNQQNYLNKSPKKVDQMIQFPQISELKIFSPQNTDHLSTGPVKPIHSIRNHFGQQKAKYLFNDYQPKSKIIQQFQNQFDQFRIKKYKNGVYFGQLNQKEQKSGKGVIFYFSGKLYEGQFLEDLKHGQGYEEFPDHSKYIGKFFKGYKHGQGIFYWPNGEIYQGQWFQGKKHGSGFWKSPEGESYIGQWKNGQVEGFGVYVTKNSDRYQGQFKNSQKNGYGTERFFNGQTYVGEFLKNRPNGQGQYFWPNGDYYKGAFLNHLKHGNGYFKSNRTGLTYQGNFLNDKKCGYGQLTLEETTYTGNFQNDFKHGYGQLYENGECKFKGYWVNDKPLDQDNESIIETTPHGVSYQRNPSIISERPEFLEENKQKLRQNILKQKKQKQKNRSPKHLASKANLEIKRMSKSKSPHDRSIESIQNSLEKSNHRRACGCTRRH